MSSTVASTQRSSPRLMLGFAQKMAQSVVESSRGFGGYVMKNLLGGVALSLCLAAPAMAADMPVKARPAPAVAAAYNWSGCYIGIQGGFGLQRTDNSFAGTGAV